MTAGEADHLEESGDAAAAVAKLREAIEIAPEMIELRFWAGLTFAQGGDLDGGCKLIAEAVRKDRRWLETIQRLVAVDRLSAELASSIEAHLAAVSPRL